MVIFKVDLSHNKTKLQIVLHLLHVKDHKNVRTRIFLQKPFF